MLIKVTHDDFEWRDQLLHAKLTLIVYFRFVCKQEINPWLNVSSQGWWALIELKLSLIQVFMCCKNNVDMCPVCGSYVKNKKLIPESTPYSSKFTDIENENRNQNLTGICSWI